MTFSFYGAVDKAGLPRCFAGKKSANQCRDTRDMGSVLGLGRAAGVGSGNPLQYSGLGNFMDTGVWQATVRESESNMTEQLSTQIRLGFAWIYGTCLV